MPRFTFWLVVLGCSREPDGQEPFGFDPAGTPDDETSVEDPSDVEEPTEASSIDGAWVGACDGEVLPPGTTTATGYYEPTVLMCVLAVVEDPAGILGGAFQYELWYLFSDWEYLLGEGNLVLDGSLVGTNVHLDVLRDTFTIGWFDLVFADETLAGSLTFVDEEGAEYVNACAFMLDD